MVIFPYQHERFFNELRIRFLATQILGHFKFYADFMKILKTKVKNQIYFKSPRKSLYIYLADVKQMQPYLNTRKNIWI